MITVYADNEKDMRERIELANSSTSYHTIMAMQPKTSEGKYITSKEYDGSGQLYLFDPETDERTPISVNDMEFKPI